MHALRVNRTKITSRNAFTVKHFALASEIQSKTDKKIIFYDLLHGLGLSLNS